MNTHRTFSLEEARSMLPQLRNMLRSAKEELYECAEIIEVATAEFQRSEAILDSIQTNTAKSAEVTELRDRRTNFENAIENLSRARSEYMDCLNTWIEKISATGVLLRDMQNGLLDFPAKNGDFEYFLCWREPEDEIAYWHLANDGYVGRKPLAVLAEYVEI